MTPEAAETLVRKLLSLEVQGHHWTEQLREAGVELAGDLPIGTLRLVDAALDVMAAPDAARPYLHDVFLEALSHGKNDQDAVDRYLVYLETEAATGWPGSQFC